MKLSKLLTFILIFSSGSIYTQQGWFWQNPLPQGNYLNSISYVNSSVVYVSGECGSLMKSTNGGVNFTVIQTGLRDNLAVNFINELSGFSPASGGLLKTTDGGFSWQYIPAPVNGVKQAVQGTTLDLYSLTDTVVYKSTNVGLNWFVSIDPKPNVINAFHFVNSLTGYAAGRKAFNQGTKFYITSNGGNTWDSIPSNIRSVITSLFFVNTGTGYAVTSSFIYKILKTTNGCQSWDTLINLTSSQTGSYINFFNFDEGYALHSNLLYKTTNAGINWLTFGAVNNTRLVNINEGLKISGPYIPNLIYRTTTSGENWVQISQSISANELLDVTFLNENTGFTVSFDKIIKTTDGGTNWGEYNLGLQSWQYVENIMFVNDLTGYAGIDGGRIAKTTNCGINWNVYATGSYDHNHGMSFPSADTGYAVTKYGSYLKSTNGGVNWVNLGQAGNYGYGDVSFANNNTGFTAGDTNYRGVLRRTTNGGNNWNTIYIDSISYFHDAFSSSLNNWFAVGARLVNAESLNKGIIARSTNIGLTWELSFFPNTITAIHFPTTTIGYASTSGSIMYKSTNSGESWLPTECINASESYGLFFINENTGWATGFSGQIIKTTTGGGAPIGIEPVSSVVPESFMLFQNYPNPFNPVTRIKFNIPASGSMNIGAATRLLIYDLLGREVKLLLNQNLVPGEYSIDFDASNLPSGVYFYQLTAGENKESRKMILLK